MAYNCVLIKTLLNQLSDKLFIQTINYQHNSINGVLLKKGEKKFFKIMQKTYCQIQIDML